MTDGFDIFLYNPSLEQSLYWCNLIFNPMHTTSDMNGHISSTTLFLNQLATDDILNLTTLPDVLVEDKQLWENPTREGCVSSLNKSNPIQNRFLKGKDEACSCVYHRQHLPKHVLLLVVKPEILGKNFVNNSPAYGLAPCVIRTSAAMVFNMQNNWFSSPAPSVLRNETYIYALYDVWCYNPT